MLKYKRPAGSNTEVAFINKFLMPLHGAVKDAFGNVWVTVGESPNLMWSSHTDTVHSKDGFQDLIVDGPFITADTGRKREKTNCLGADCTSGVWLMVKMIEAKVPGLYIFHREEEVGGNGSKWIAKNKKDELANIQFAIALDRMDYKSVITHQGGVRCCSDAFAEALALALGNNFAPDNTGVFTDTANYTDIIPEGTNISVGYFSQHGPTESQNWVFLNHLLEILSGIDFSGFIPQRDPSEYESLWGSIAGGFYSRSNDNPLTIEDFVYQHAYYASEFLYEHGFRVEDLIEFRAEKRDKYKKERLW